jgi:protein involved in polysaccharide export with SLBB domain
MSFKRHHSVPKTHATILKRRGYFWITLIATIAASACSTTQEPRVESLPAGYLTVDGDWPEDAASIFDPMVIRGTCDAREVELCRIIDIDGCISLLTVGWVQVAGLTPDEIDTKLREEHARFHIPWDLHVELGRIPTGYHISGAVAREGKQPIVGDSRVAEAVSRALPDVQRADLQHVWLIRHSPGSRSAEFFYIDVASDPASRADEIRVQDGDCLIVPDKELEIPVIDEIEGPRITIDDESATGRRKTSNAGFGALLPRASIRRI